MLLSWSLTMSTLQNSRGYISIFIFKTYQHHSSWWNTSSSVKLSLLGAWDAILSWVFTCSPGQHSPWLKFPASFCSRNIGVLQGSTFWTLCSLNGIKILSEIKCICLLLPNFNFQPRPLPLTLGLYSHLSTQHLYLHIQYTFQPSHI